jgi:hypothetical protein
MIPKDEMEELIPPDHEAEHPELFPMGRIHITPEALAALIGQALIEKTYLLRHVHGDWGEVGQEDWALNDRALVDGSRILSAYTTERGIRIWIITEADRSSTTILLPDEY